MPASALKCASEHNHYGVRNQIINNNSVSPECPICSEPETWDYVMLCPCIKLFRKKFIEGLLKDLLKNRLPVVEYKEIFDMMEDILVCLEKGNEDECTTNQHMIDLEDL